jgi:hypothetical protein
VKSATLSGPGCESAQSARLISDALAKYQPGGTRGPWFSHLYEIRDNLAAEAERCRLFGNGALRDHDKESCSDWWQQQDAWEHRAQVIDRAAGAMEACGRSHVRGCDSSGHRVAALLYCRRPGCACGAIVNGDEGKALAFRMRRSMPRLEWSGHWAYYSVTTTAELRDSFRTRPAMSALHRLTADVGMILRPESPGGLTRIHEFGDEGPDFKPHGNGLMPLPEGARWKVSKAKLKAARRHVAAVLGIPFSRAVVWYSYVPPEKRSHKLRYVLRDTMHQHAERVAEADVVTMLVSLKGEHKVRYFGELSPRKWRKFSQTPAVQEGLARWKFKENEAVKLADKGCCPACGERLHWELCAGSIWSGEQVKWIELTTRNGHGTGYYVDEFVWMILQERERRNL